MSLSAAELAARLEEMGFEQVDETAGFKGDLKWRHGSAMGSKGFGSIWVKDGQLSINGKRSGGYERILTRWVKPSYVDTSLNNPFGVWRGAELTALLDAMSARVTPHTHWPPV